MSLLPLTSGQRPGLQSSERSSCQVVIYNKAQGLDQLQLQGQLICNGKSLDGRVTVTGVQTSNALASGGTFQVGLIAEEGFDLIDAIQVDDWIDITFYRGRVGWHAFRGLIDDVRQDERVVENGATIVTATVTGRSFQKVWATTSTYFHPLLADNLGGMFLLETLGTDRFLGTPQANVTAILTRFLEKLGEGGNANWQMPKGMPGTRGTFVDTVSIDTTGYEKVNLPRFAATGQGAMPETDLWALAMQYADLQYCELFTVLLPPGGMDAYRSAPDQPNGFRASQSQMAVVYRDRPYPRVSAPSRGPLAMASPYFSLPTHKVRRTDITALSMGKSSFEVFDNFSVVNSLTQSRSGAYAEEQFPLQSSQAKEVHGLRRMDASSFYEADVFGGLSDLELALAQRSRLRDWYCLGATLRNGSLQFARGWPEIQVGSRLVIDDDNPLRRLTFYIEGVHHVWSPGSLKTSLDITRGYRGTDAQHIAKLTKEARTYDVQDGTVHLQIGNVTFDADDLPLEPIPDDLPLVPIPR